ncbi:Ig-like domain-containing protein, partial [Shewanella sp.]|uniref:Ig-like domain-containing protein n=1 Tax=Shewanella sp. TaxID=50422 RepID=UPI000E82B001
MIKLFRFLWLFLVVFISACGGGSESNVLLPDGVDVYDFYVEPSDVSVAVGDTKQLKVLGYAAEQKEFDITSSVTWSISDPLIASISDSGLVTAKAIGQTTGYALFNNTRKPFSVVVSDDSPLESLHLSPEYQNLISGS